MADNTDNQPNDRTRRRYLWPWFVLGAILLAILLAVLWMSKEIDRTRRLRELNSPAQQTDTVPAK